MAKNNSLPDFVKDVADALRAKKGTTAKINPQNFSSEIASIETATEPNLQNKTVNPTTSQQSVTADSGYDGLNSVTVTAVTSSIDANISAENIKSGVSILGVTGTLQEGITPTGTLEIKENGLHNVANYEWAEVSVEADLNERVIIGKWEMPNAISFVFKEDGVCTTIMDGTHYEGVYTIVDNQITILYQEEVVGVVKYDYDNDTLVAEDDASAIWHRVPTNLTTKEITENGTYKASDDGADGYSEVVVNVASGGDEEIVVPPPFASATVTDIKRVGNEISAKGLTSDKVSSLYGWNIGDKRNITLTTGEVIQMRIIGFNHDTLSDGSGTAGITLEMSDALINVYSMDSERTNAGGWAVTDMRTTTLPTIKATLPQEWQNIVKKVDKKSANGGSTNFSEVVTTSDDLFLLSEYEVLGSFDYAQNSSDEGVRYEYYTKNSSSSDRIKEPGSYVTWWLRSCAYNYTTSFCNINYNGSVGTSSPTSTLSVSFAFCVGSAKDIPVAGLPIELSTDTEMTNALVEDNLGKVYKFTGTSDTYETDAIYIVSEVE